MGFFFSIWEVFSHFCFEYFFCSFFPLLSSIMNMFLCLMMFHISLRLCLFISIISLFSSNCTISILLCPTFLILFSANPNLLLSHLVNFSYLLLSFSILKSPLFLFYIFCPFIDIIYFMKHCHHPSPDSLSMISFSSLNIPIIPALKSFSDKSNIWALSKVVSIACLYLCIGHTLFLLTCIIFLLKGGHLDDIL